MRLCIASYVMSAALAAAAPLTLPQAVEQSIQKYPSIRVSLEQVSAAAAQVQLSRTSFLPKADFYSQVNRATRNNVFGMLLPQSTIAPISGPPLHENKMTNVWGTAVGFLVSWEPFDFGLRKAQVDAADVSRKRAEAAVDKTKLEVSTTTADAFLTMLAAQQLVASAKANVARARVLETAVSALVKAELRPGSDAERTRAEIALAETQLIQAEQAVNVARAALAQMLGVAPSEIEASAGKLLDTPPAIELADTGVAAHPALQEQRVAIDEVKARQAALDKVWYPRFLLQGATYARGTGAFPDGRTGGAASGLGPNIANWGLGFSVFFPLIEQPSLKARQSIETHKERSESARLELMQRELNGQLDKAKAILDGARKAAQQAPVQLSAARTLEQQSIARYKAGLTSIVEVAEAQRLLAQAESDNALAKLNIWRALLAVAVSKGNLSEFLEKVR